MTPGQVAYEAYSAAVGGASAVTGTVLPSWAGQRPDIREAWEVAADAVLRATFAQPVVSTGTLPPEGGGDRQGDRVERIAIPPNTPPPGGL